MACTISRRWLKSGELLLLMIAILQMAIATNCLEFHYEDFTNISKISFENFANVSDTGTTAVLLPGPYLEWATDPNNSTYYYWSGWMTYKDPIPFLATDTSTGAVIANSFNTSFTFNLITGAERENSPSGMAFFITSTDKRPDGYLPGYFGIGNASDPANFFAVEFDTHLTTGTNDPSSSHVGIDISSINSSVLLDTSGTSTGGYYPDLYLYNNYTFTVWISYDSSSQKTKVWMTNTSSNYSDYLNPPQDILDPILHYVHDLSSIFISNDNLYVGFSAATQSNTAMLGAVINSWYLSINEESNAIMAPPPSSAPPPPPATSSSTATQPSSSTNVKNTAAPDRSMFLVFILFLQLTVAFVALFL